MAAQPNLVLFDAEPARTAQLRALLDQRGIDAVTLPVDQISGTEQIPKPDVALLVLGAARPEDRSEIEQLVRQLADNNVATLVWGQAGFAPTNHPMLECFDDNVTVPEIVGHLSTATHYGPLVRRMERELSQLQRLGDQLNRYFSEVDQEMRLAGRLQRDFLPTTVPDLEPFTIQTLYRPASWVSGDTYDVFRIDEKHAGVFLGDAMGHGVAAGMITMFLQQALVSTKLERGQYRIVSPSESLTELHNRLASQKLPNCQFITGVYAVLSPEQGSVRFSRAGHPLPIHFSQQHGLREVPAEGGLLGLADIEPDFEEVEVRMDVGDKLLLFTDGLEDAIVQEMPAVTDADQNRFMEWLEQWRDKPGLELMESIRGHLDNQAGSLHPTDDVTLIIIERT